MDLVYRPRRLRRTAPIRGLVRETELSPRQLIYPVFVTEGKSVRDHIDSMPGQFRLSTDVLVRECEELYALGVGAVNLFGYSKEKDEVRILNSPVPEYSLFINILFNENTE